VRRRRLFTVASGISLLLCLTMVGMWAHSYSSDDLLFIGQSFVLESHDGAVRYRTGWRNPSSPQFFVTSSPTAQWIVPYVFISPLLMLSTVLLYVASRRKIRAGVCPSCGYCLTGNTSGTCPECGTPVPKEPADKSPRPA
jgi:hypothetical protein